MSTFEILLERPDTADARALIAELEAQLNPHYPPQSRHGYSVDKLLREGVHFFVARHTAVVVGCGGVQFFGTAYAEAKRMYVRPAYRGQGAGRQMLDHLAAFARQHGLPLLRLETGIHQEPAMRLYERYGFVRVGPFGDYPDDPLSVYYELRLC